MRVRRSLVAVVFLVAACARTGLLDFGRGDESDGDAGAGGSGGTGALGGTGGTSVPQHECATTAECPVLDPCAPPTCRLDGTGSNAVLRCVAMPLDCNDQNPCTRDECDSLTGCTHEPPRDEDGDGYIGEAPEGAPAECGGGEDCDDTRANVHPFANEICDGLDNDCNGGIDENDAYTFVRVAPVPISPPERGRATHGGLVFGEEAYAVSYNTTASPKRAFFKLITPFGQDASTEDEVSRINADAYAGTIEWSGENFFTAFSDARQSGNYEVYAARYRSDGVKVQSDIRLTDAPDFSLNAAAVWTGDEYVVAWDDRRARRDGGVPQIFARRFSELGMPVGSEVLITSAGEWGEYPALALGDDRIGLAYVTVGADGVSHVRFRALDSSFGQVGSLVDVPGSSSASYASIAVAAGQFFVSWAFTFAASMPGGAVHMATVSETSGAVVGGGPVTAGFTFVRGSTLVSLGNRVLVFYSGAGPDGAYELYGSTVGDNLLPTSPTRLTFSDALSLFPFAARGPDGTVGIVFDEDRETPPTSRRPHFMSVGCLPPTLP